MSSSWSHFSLLNPIETVIGFLSLLTWFFFLFQSKFLCFVLFCFVCNINNGILGNKAVCCCSLEVVYSWNLFYFYSFNTKKVIKKKDYFAHDRSSLKGVRFIIQLLLFTGPLSCQEAVPPVAGAALYQSPDDPGHVHPHVTFTGQFSQHQAVHIAMKEDTSSAPHERWGRDLQLSLSSFCATSLVNTKRLSEPVQSAGQGLHQSPEPQEGHYTDFRVKMDVVGGSGYCRLCDTRG